MLTSLWRRMRQGNGVPSKRKYLSKDRRAYRPCLEPLEGRELPALLAGGLMVPAMPSMPAMAHAPAVQMPVRTAPIYVTVPENTPETVIDLGPVFAAIPGIQHEDGLQLSVLGNTNATLVRTDLSDSALTLTYRSGQYGRATIVVCATDADGVSVRQTLLVTVRPSGAIGAGNMPAAPPPALGTVR
jgi:hypothetical protein